MSRGVRRGDLVKVRRGAYMASPDASAPPWRRSSSHLEALMGAADRQISADVAFAYSSAAFLHGLALVRVPRSAHLVQSYPPRVRETGGLIRHVQHLDPEDVVVLRGRQVTSLARTVSDCLKTMTAPEAFAMGDSALRLARGHRRYLADHQCQAVRELCAEISRQVERGLPRGRRRARELLQALDPGAESVGESLLRWIFWQAGMPRPLTQVAVETRLGRRYGDVGWECDGGRLIVEFDGQMKYGGNRQVSVDAAVRAVVAEKQREDAMREVRGTRILRFTWRDLRDPESIVGRVIANLPGKLGRRLNPRGDLGEINAVIPAGRHGPVG